MFLFRRENAWWVWPLLTWLGLMGGIWLGRFIFQADISDTGALAVIFGSPPQSINKALLMVYLLSGCIAGLLQWAFLWRYFETNLGRRIRGILLWPLLGIPSCAIAILFNSYSVAVNGQFELMAGVGILVLFLALAWGQSVLLRDVLRKPRLWILATVLGGTFFVSGSFYLSLLLGFLQVLGLTIVDFLLVLSFLFQGAVLAVNLKELPVEHGEIFS